MYVSVFDSHFLEISSNKFILPSSNRETVGLLIEEFFDLRINFFKLAVAFGLNLDMFES